MLPESQHIIGVDLGGTKLAVAAVRFPHGEIVTQEVAPADPKRGGDAVLNDIVAMVRKIAASLPSPPVAVGLGVAELVSPIGEVQSDATFAWRDRPIAEELRTATGLSCWIEADVRAAAWAEAHFGAGRGHNSFLLVTVGTGVSASLVIEGVPYVGARGLTGTFASSPVKFAIPTGELATSPPLEQFSAGPALAARLSAHRPTFRGDAREVVALANSGDAIAKQIVISAGEALGAAIGGLVNMLDPEVVILGGGLGVTEGMFRHSVESALRAAIWSDLHRELPLLTAELGPGAGVLGAAYFAWRNNFKSSQR